jgi:hypothetical protein
VQRPGLHTQHLEERNIKGGFNVFKQDEFNFHYKYFKVLSGELNFEFVAIHVLKRAVST